MAKEGFAKPTRILFKDVLALVYEVETNTAA
jgi:hypothetical protein